MSDYIDEVFGATGALAKRFPGYEPREGQIAMTRAVDAAIKNDGHLLVEAGTGTGKSLAYAVPAIYHALQRRENAAPGAAAIIVTANIALQEQLVRKDLPLLSEILTWPFDYALLKGKQNFLCVDRLINGAPGAPDAADAEAIEKIVEWANHTETGDVSELPFEPPYSAWSRFSVGSDDCVGSECDYYKSCFSELARKHAQRAHVVVTNYHLFFADMKIRQVTGGMVSILPKYDIAVLDECFVAGTLVDGRPIETVRAGDTVRSFDESTQTFVQRRVNQLFVSKPSMLVRVSIGGHVIVCTAGHSFLTTRGWIPAADLHIGDSVVSTRHETNFGEDAVHSVRQRGLRNGQEDVRRQASRSGILFAGTHCFMEEQAHERNTEGCDNTNAKSFTRGTHARIPQSDEVRSYPSKSRSSSSYGRLETRNQWWQRQTSPASPAGHGCGAGLALRGCRQNKEASGSTLFDRYSERGAQDSDRDRRQQSRRASAAESRSSQAGVFGVARVDRVEVLEPTSDGRFGGVCSDGLVYNLEVEGTHTYLVEDLVVHNCHKATDIARDFFGFRITEGSLGWAGSMLPWEERAGLEHAAQAFFMSLRAHKNSGVYKARLRKADAVDSSFIVAALRKAQVAYGDMIAPLFGEDATTEQRKEAIKIARKLGRIVEIEKQIELAMRLRSSPKQPWQPVPSSPDDTSGVRWYWSDPGLGGNNTVKSEADASSIDDVFYIEEDRGKTVLCSRPIRVAERLREELFKTTKSVLMTSATLMARGSFDFIANDLGVDKPTTLEAKSPFNWREAALLVTPPDVPEPNAAEFTRTVAQKCRETIEYARGRTLALFTSYKNLNAAHEAVLHTGYRILRQGDMPRTQLIDEFRKDTNSVLLGVESFWAGVDVPGESLSCVFIDRLPFITPEDPVMDALSESDREWFMKYSVPRAIIAFKQGFGRLIRTVNDRGVVVLLDRRISTKFYGKFFINSLPSVQRSYNLEDVRRFLDREELVLTATDRAPDSKSLFG